MALGAQCIDEGGFACAPGSGDDIGFVHGGNC